MGLVKVFGSSRGAVSATWASVTNVHRSVIIWAFCVNFILLVSNKCCVIIRSLNLLLFI